MPYSKGMGQIQVHIRQLGETTSESEFRGHRVKIDRPLEKGGSDQGPMGGELFLSSVGGCFMSNLLAAIRARQSGIANARVEVTGTLADAPPRFTAIELLVSAEGAKPEELEHLIDIADRGCIMMNTLRGKIEVKIRTGVAA